MTETLTKIVVNCETGVQEVLPLTEAELAQRETDAATYAAQKAIEEAEEAAKATAKASAEAKLKALGLSDAEIASLK
jgi:hypothetical protein